MAKKEGLSINIAPNMQGTFTEWCKRHGYGNKVTQKCITAGKNSKDKRIRKKATFAQNARSWNK